MKDLLVLLAHLLTTVPKLLGPGGARAVVAESLLMKQQLLVISRSRRRAPNLSTPDRILLVLMNRFSRRISGYGVHTGDVDGIALCRMFNRAISGKGEPRYLSSDHDPLQVSGLRIPATALHLPEFFAYREFPAETQARDRTVWLCREPAAIQSPGKSLLPAKVQGILRPVQLLDPTPCRYGRRRNSASRAHRTKELLRTGRPPFETVAYAERLRSVTTFTAYT